MSRGEEGRGRGWAWARRRRRDDALAGETAAAGQERRGGRMGAVEHAREAAIGLSPQGKILSWNRGAEQLFGYAAEEVLGRQIELLVPARLRERELAAVAAGLERGETVHLETVWQRKDGGEVPVGLVAAPLMGGYGPPRGGDRGADRLGRAAAPARAVARGARAV